MSKMISNHKGMRNGLRLINNYIVDSKMFEIVMQFLPLYYKTNLFFINRFSFTSALFS